jgi:hypothetical protein
MTRTHTYELGFTAPRGGLPAFPEAVSGHARRYGIRWTQIEKGRDEGTRRQVDSGRIRIGLFLNTQADGANMESPAMLLCRSLKANGCVVVEDPDDAPVYTNGPLTTKRLKRAGFAVDEHHLSKRGGKGRRSRVVGTRFAVWHLMGHVISFMHPKGEGVPELATAAGIGSDRLLALADNASRISHLTGLDWFVTELTEMHVRGKARYRVTILPNALAALGPGAASLRRTPREAVECAAASIVQAAWRRSKGLDLTDGTTTIVGTSEPPSPNESEPSL